MMRAALAGLLLLAASPALAGEADVLAVAVERHAGTEDMFDVRATILSNDTGPDYYADAVEVLAPDGRVLGRLELAQPHADEQPFTRALENLKVPVGIDRVTVRARHKPRGYDGQTVTVRLPR
jgi:hypothetical protein